MAKTVLKIKLCILYVVVGNTSVCIGQNNEKVLRLFYYLNSYYDIPLNK